jgi:Tol biopolymer transport system component
MPQALTGSQSAHDVIQSLPMDEQLRNNAAFAADYTPTLSLTQKGCQVSRLHDSPDGRWIVIDTDCDLQTHTQVLDVTTGEMLKSDAGFWQDSIFLNWAPDSNAVLLRTDPIGENKIVLANLADNSATVLDTPPYTYDAALAPDNQRILYAVNRGLGWGGELWSMNRDGTDKRLILKESKHIIVYASWSPDGSAIAYIRMLDTNIPFTVGELWLANGAGNSRRMIAPADAGHGYRPMWSPDGRRVAFVGRENQQDSRANLDAEALESNIYVVTVDTGMVQAATNFQGSLTDMPVWSPDGKYLAFSKKEGDESSIWLVEIGTGTVQQVTRDERARWPVWAGSLY